MSEPALRVCGVRRVFLRGRERLEVLKGIDLTIRGGERVAVIGPSGAGKSTLLHIAGGLLRPSEGEVHVGGAPLHGLADEALARIRSERIGFVFQLHHLLPEFNALENAMLPALVRGVPRRQAARDAEAWLAAVGLSARRSHKPGELSGGEQQRVAIARALINRPAILLADEPTGDLDGATAREIHALLVRLNRDQGQTLVMVTHNPELSRLAERVIVLRDGAIERDGGTDAV